METLNVKIVKKSNILDEELEYFYKYLKTKNINIVENIEKANLLISFGGDGTILSLVPLLTKNNIEIFSINYGNVGYMTKISKEDAISSFEEYLKGNYTIDSRDLLEVEFNNKKYYALNELSILKFEINSSLINVEVYQEKELINTYRADGILVSTPTGSTAYSLSSGGPIIQPSLKVLCITPLAPQNLSARSIVIEPYKKLKFKAYGRNEFIGLNIDGNLHFKIKSCDEISAILSNKTIKLIDIKKVNYFDVLKKKLYWS